MANYGKKFEEIIKNTLSVIPNFSLDRLYDQMSGNFGSKNISDFQAYVYPYQFYLECKTIQGGTLPFKCVTDGQFNGMLEKSTITGTIAGIIVWFYEKDITCFINITEVNAWREKGYKSINVKDIIAGNIPNIIIKGTKRRTFWDYDGQNFVVLLKQEAYKRWLK